MKMRNVFVAFVLAVGLFALAFYGWGSLGAQPKEPIKDEPAGPEGPYFVSFFWVGLSESDCLFRDTLLLDTMEACEAEYERAEAEIKKFVESQQAEGLELKWGVIARCKRYNSYQAYADDVNKYTNKCMGK